LRYLASEPPEVKPRKQVFLDLYELMRAALKHARRRDFSDRSFVEPLQRLIEAQSAECDLSGFGRYAARFDIMRSLRNLLHFDAMEEVWPDVPSRPIHRPIFVTGLPRSGTTFLHELLLQHPGIIGPLSWQMIYPYPWRAPFGATLCKSWVECQLGVMCWSAPELRQLHPLSADAPQECTDITAQVFQSLRFETIYRVPSYQAWLAGHGHLNAYRFHRRFLQHLDAQAPGRRWVVKSPDHVFALDEIRTVYPDAQIVFLHRDPVSVLASVAKLTEVLRRPFVRRVDRFEIGRQVCASWIEGSNRMADAAAGSDSILHLHYNQLVADPIKTVASLCRHCGLAFDDGIRQRMERWLARAQHDESARRNYRLAAFGLDAQVLRRQFARYSDTFAIPSEWHDETSGTAAIPCTA
jgi:hypothetical protein